jgi:hypothetical protein
LNAGNRSSQVTNPEQVRHDFLSSKNDLKLTNIDNDDDDNMALLIGP